MTTIPPECPPKRCIGMVADSNHILVQCPETWRTTRFKLYHSQACQAWTLHRRQHGLALGDSYFKHRFTLKYPPGQCQKGWTIRGGVIAKCAEPFTRHSTLKQYHSAACTQRTLAWQRLGRRLGDSVRRTCAYRDCHEGEGGTRKTFDRLARNKSGLYFCCKAHKMAELHARVADRVAQAERILAQRPSDWNKPRRRNYRIVATLLLVDSDLSNRQLAGGLEDLGIFKCPYNTAGWRAAEEEGSRAFVVFINRVRDWINVPGQERGSTHRASIHK
jgi:hypothetical protein